MANIQTKPKRVRLSPNKKWTVDEEKALVEFLLENKDIELYYKRFADEKGTAIEWKLARTKVCNMRLSYNQAKSWECSTGAGSMDGDTIKNTLHRMCRFYDAFDDILGSRFVDAAIVEDSITSISTSDLVNTEVVFESTVTSDSSIMGTESKPSTSRKGVYSRTAVSDIMEMQAEAMKIKKLKLDQNENRGFRFRIVLNTRFVTFWSVPPSPTPNIDAVLRMDNPSPEDPNRYSTIFSEILWKYFITKIKVCY